MDDVMHAAVNKDMLYGFFSAMMVTGSKLTKSLGPKYQRAAQVSRNIINAISQFMPVESNKIIT